MTERLLQFIWQFQYFNARELLTTEGEPLQVIQPGQYNTNQGPDFSNAKIQVAGTTWAGTVELHINSSDWKIHGHSSDRNYRNVILHVVWNHDKNIGLPFPTLELQDKVSKLLLHKYEELVNATAFIPCGQRIQEVTEIAWLSWKEKLLVERLLVRTQAILQQLESAGRSWEEILWWSLARNFGSPVNGALFEEIARSVPIMILARHKNQLQQLEALLFGQAGLLEEEFTEQYPRLLQKEYRFLDRKYRLKKINGRPAFLRMRPSAFPTVRLAQLAVFIQQSRHFFSVIRESEEIKDLYRMLDVTANDYWHYHYLFGETSAYRKKKLGRQLADSILINTVVPMLFALGHYHRMEAYKDKALRWLGSISAESNNITEGFSRLGLQAGSAFDSQAFIQLKHVYCDARRCLDCVVGAGLLRSVSR
ncbi:MAG: DUF2851 family protein [Ferruginibacter sp.]